MRVGIHKINLKIDSKQNWKQYMPNIVLGGRDKMIKIEFCLQWGANLVKIMTVKFIIKHLLGIYYLMDIILS